MPYKLDLLRYASKRGPAMFIGQLVCSARDTLWSAKHLVFVYDVGRKGPPAQPDRPDLTFAEAPGWAAFSLEEQQALEDSAVEWGDSGWFEQGWRLWTGRLDGRLAITIWWRTTGQSPNFFVPMEEGSILLWQTATLPEARGGGLYTAALTSLMAHEIANGVQLIYANCRDYNFPPRRNMERMGFERLGQHTDNRWTGKQSWRPA